MVPFTLKEFITVFLFSLPFVVLTFWAIIDLSRTQTKAIYTKFFWLAFVILVPYIGGLCYLLFGRKVLKKKEA
ncbi:MAG: PLDc N-terminal domain-containing protein [Candidatus Desulfofervidaceae bacterium]|nr:PLDc N-terminal domain-containing protein [Candidatus Desulfofervidaceae bacterium]